MHRLVRLVLLAGAIPLSSSWIARAQPATTESPRKQATAVRVPDGAIVVDGELDDAAWRAAPVLTDFTQKQPNEGAAPTDRMEVRLAYDGGALYVGARMYAKELSSIQAPVSRRDNISQSEHLYVSLDTYLDRRTAYTFAVTASGVRGDWYHASDDEYEVDLGFEPVWEASARMDSLGWTAEMRIPFSQLRFTAGARQRWGLNIDRWIPSRNEDVFWVPVPRNVTAWASRFGDLVGIEGIQPTRRIELLPYVATQATMTGVSRDPRNPFDDGRNLGARVGGDLKMGLGPNLTLEATVNPDFGQVEADPEEVNLSAFETFFSERRPFFTEGSQLLSGNGPSYFYSRRIGAVPSLTAGIVEGAFGEDGAFVDVPRESTILGAAKITGRLASGTSLGALAAVTERESATGMTRVERAPGDTISSFETISVAPRTYYGVTRVEQEFGRHVSTVGLMISGVHRAMMDGDWFASLLPRDAISGGADWNLRFGGGEYVLGGYAGGSHVRGDSAVIERLQRSSARYFQRPDADHVELDPSRRTLSGWSGGLELERISGRHWLWEVEAGAESPGLELNDAGRLSTADGIFGAARITYRETQPKGFYRSYSISGTTENEWNFGRERGFGALRTDMSLTLKSHHVANFTSWIDFRSQNHSLTRGGPLMQTPQAWVVIGQFSTSFAASTQWNGRIYYGQSEQGDMTYRISGGFSFRPSPQWQLSVSPNYLRDDYTQQFIGSSAGGPPATYGRRYVFSTIDRTEYRMPIRLNYALRPDLTLEMYGEPFVSTGRYHDFGELERARGRTLRSYEGDATRVVHDGARHTVFFGVDANGDGREDSRTVSDFTVRALNSNLVLRWEWRPGSTFYGVWQQSRDEFDPRGDKVRARDVWNAFSARGRNFFVLKSSFWIPVR